MGEGSARRRLELLEEARADNALEELRDVFTRSSDAELLEMLELLRDHDDDGMVGWLADRGLEPEDVGPAVGLDELSAAEQHRRSRYIWSGMSPERRRYLREAKASLLHELRQADE